MGVPYTDGMTTDDLFTTWTDADPQNIISAVNELLSRPWHTGGATLVRHELHGVTVESSRTCPAHTLPLLQSVDFWDDPDGEKANAAFAMATPRIDAIERAAIDAWGPSESVSYDSGAETLLDFILMCLGEGEAQVWTHGDRMIAYMCVQGDKELPICVAITVLPATAMEEPYRHDRRSTSAIWSEEFGF